MEKPKDLETQVLEWEKMETQSLMVEVFGVGTVEIDVQQVKGEERPLLEVHFYPLGHSPAVSGGELKPIASMRTLMPLAEQGTEVEH